MVACQWERGGSRIRFLAHSPFPVAASSSKNRWGEETAHSTAEGARNILQVIVVCVISRYLDVRHVSIANIRLTLFGYLWVFFGWSEEGRRRRCAYSFWWCAAESREGRKTRQTPPQVGRGGKERGWLMVGLWGWLVGCGLLLRQEEEQERAPPPLLPVPPPSS